MGLLHPGDSDELTSIIHIKHPNEDTEWTQASFLSPESMEALTAFQQHAMLLAAQAEVRQRLAQLHKTHHKLNPPPLTEEEETEGASSTGNDATTSAGTAGGTASGARGSLLAVRSPSASAAASVFANAAARAVGPRTGAVFGTRSSLGPSAGAQIAAMQARLERDGGTLTPERLSIGSAASGGLSLTVRRWNSFGSGESNISDLEPILRCAHVPLWFPVCLRRLTAQVGGGNQDGYKTDQKYPKRGRFAHICYRN